MLMETYPPRETSIMWLIKISEDKLSKSLELDQWDYNPNEEHAFKKFAETWKEEWEAMAFELGTAPMFQKFCIMEKLFQHLSQLNGSSQLPWIFGVEELFLAISKAGEHQQIPFFTAHKTYI